MKLLVSVSATKLTAELLMKKQTGTYHSGIQKVSNINGADILWNYVAIVDGKSTAVMTKEEAVGIAAAGKFYKFK